MECLYISVKGIVQGVGFRPFIYNLARELSLKGYVTNTSDGVEISAEGRNLELFLERVRKEAPPLSKIMSIDITPAECQGYIDFSIRCSSEAGLFTLVSADTSVCGDCLREMLDRVDRRYLYPFINCTNCGPRYSITRAVPYDRSSTTMNVFQMCSRCQAEYDDPENRRFHAQPNACHDCGPRVELIDKRSPDDRASDPVGQTIGLLKKGDIVGVKGLGGFHLACDAANDKAVQKLRERKRKSNKPFALMAPTVDAIREFCHITADEERMLISRKRPAVLLRKRDDCCLSYAISPNNRYIAFMLPYTPLHYLLFYYPASDHSPLTPDLPQPCNFEALAMTSGNITEEPIVISNDEAVEKLSASADAFLVHDRNIFMRVDDSVVKLPGNITHKAGDLKDDGSGWSKGNHDSSISFIRRARGYVPDPIPLPDEGPDVLGCGADLKNTFTITKGRYAIPCQHIGDMENFETLQFFEETLRNLRAVYRAVPEAIAHDLHPGYMSTQWAMRQEGIKKYAVQHHYAHIASVMAEKGIKEKVIGVAFDGTGYGGDGTLWGGEFLVADLTGFKRAGHIEYIPLPGGEMAIKEPWRISVSYMKKAAGNEIWKYMAPSGFISRYGKEKIENIIKISEQTAFSPLSSGAGRLFDAVSALIGLCDINTYEGEAAIALESLIIDGIGDDYPVDISFRDPMEIDFSATILGILSDLEGNVDRRVISTKFHNTVIAAVMRVVVKLSLTDNISKVVLSGGVFQNSYLTAGIKDLLQAEGLNVYTNEIVPCNDGGISLGQAYIIRERIKLGSTDGT